MQFKIFIKKWGNFYFFIQNLSKWDSQHYREKHNKFWKEQLEDFSSIEKVALKNFKNIRSEYKYKSFFEKAFFKEEDPWSYLKDNLSHKQYNTLQNIFNLFKDKFEIIFKKNLPKLKKWEKTLKTKPDPSKIKKICKILSNLYKTSPRSQQIDIYLLMSSPSQTGGGANIDNKSITVEISQQSRSKEAINHIMALIWHEITHLYFEVGYYAPLIEKLSIPQKDRSKIKEFTTSSLFPKGILGKNFFNINKNMKEPIHPTISKKTSKKIVTLSKRYIEQEKYFDKEYIQTLHQLIHSK